MKNNRESIVILGFGGHAKSVADSIVKDGKYIIAGYTDTHDCKSRFKYLGTDDELSAPFRRGIHKAVLGVGFIGNSVIRDKLVHTAKAIGFEFPVIIDPSAVIADDVVIDEGTFIGKRAVINAETRIGTFCIINTGAIIEHENIINDYSHVAVGAILCGNVSVGCHSLIGAGTTVIQGKTIGDNCIIGANSTILSDVEDNMKCYGIVNNRGYNLTPYSHTERTILIYDERMLRRCVA